MCYNISENRLTVQERYIAIRNAALPNMINFIVGYKYKKTKNNLCVSFIWTVRHSFLRMGIS